MRSVPDVAFVISNLIARQHASELILKTQNMHVVFDSSNLNRLATLVFEDSAEVTVDL